LTGAVLGIVCLFAAIRANREMFEKEIEMLIKSFDCKPFSRKGKHYTIPPEVPYRYTLKEIAPSREQAIREAAPMFGELRGCGRRPTSRSRRCATRGRLAP
jgi:hypothetical protein